MHKFKNNNKKQIKTILLSKKTNPDDNYKNSNSF